MQKRSIISRLFRPEVKGLADPNMDLLALFGVVSSASGITISADRALTIPAVGSAIRVLSEAVACLEVMVKEVGADGSETEVVDHPALAFLRGSANDWTSGYELIRDLVIDALTDDRGGLAYVNRVGGEAREIIRYRSGVVNVDLDQNTGEPRYKINNTPVAAADMIHLRAPFGRAPLTLAREAIAVAFVLERHAANLFSAGARPSGALKFPKGMGEASVIKARAAWAATHEGTDAGGKTAILWDGAEFEPYTFTSTDAQFLENRKFQIIEIARCFRVPPSILFDMDRATNFNAEQSGKEFYIYGSEPWVKSVEFALARALFNSNERGRFVVRFDRDDISRADLATRATTINSLRASEVLNADEGRSWLGLPPRVDGGGKEYKNPNITTDPAPKDLTNAA